VVALLFSVIVHGKLTKKQQTALNSKKRILNAFYDVDEIEKHTRTWKQLKELTELSSGALSKHLKELLLGNVVCRRKSWESVQGKTHVHPISLYEITGKPIEITGKERAVEEAVRFYQIEKEITVPYQWGHLKRGRGERDTRDKRPSKAKMKNPKKGWYFVPNKGEGGFLQLKPEKKKK
jgi:hypothetical protein